jgi:hypothetical protein
VGLGKGMEFSRLILMLILFKDLVICLIEKLAKEFLILNLLV